MDHQGENYSPQYPSPKSHGRPAPYYTGQGESGSGHRTGSPFNMGAIAQQSIAQTPSPSRSYENTGGMVANDFQFPGHLPGPAPSVQQYGNSTYPAHASARFSDNFTGEGHNRGGNSNQFHGDQFFGGQGRFLDDQINGPNQPYENSEFQSFNNDTFAFQNGMISSPYQPREYGSGFMAQNVPSDQDGHVFNGGNASYDTLSYSTRLDNYHGHSNVYGNVSEGSDGFQRQIINLLRDEDEDDEDDEDNDVYVDDLPSSAPGKYIVSDEAAPEDQFAARHTKASYVPKNKTENEYLVSRARRIQQQKADLRQRGEVDTFPADPTKLWNYIGLLVDAFKMTDGVMDKVGKNGKPAQAVQRLQSGFYSDESLENVAWSLVIACRDASLGISLVDPHHKGKREGKDMHRTFDDRFFALYDAVRNSKAVCKQVLDPAYIDRLADAPKAELKMKGNNKKINAKRDVENAAGRLVNKANLTLEDIASLAKIKKEGESNGIGDSSPLSRVKKESPIGFEGSSRLFATPQKRHASATKGRTPTSRQNRTPNTSSTSKRKHANGTLLELETPAKKPASRSTMNSLSGQSYVTRQTLSSKQRTGSQSFINSQPEEVGPPAFPLLSSPDLQDQYLKDLYEFLELDWRRFWVNGGSKYTLDELRTFARAHNIDYGNAPWFHGSFVNGECAIGNKVQFIKIDGSQAIIHMSVWLPFQKYHPLFIERGEMTVGGVVNSAVQHLFSGEKTNGYLRQVLGLVANPFGIFDISNPFPAIGKSISASQATS